MEKELEKGFNEWFNEMEGFSFRSERFYDDFDYAAKTNNYDMITKWLQTAYKVGYEDGQRLYGGTE